MKKFFPYDPYNTKPVKNERQRIVGGQIRLDHVPKKGTLEVYGFEETDSAVDLLPTQFHCEYSANTYYREANRTVFFWRGRSGETVTVSYQAVASPVTADDMNEIGDFMIRADENFAAIDTALTAHKTALKSARDEAAKNLSAHDVDGDAHADIRNELSVHKKLSDGKFSVHDRQVAEVQSNVTTLNQQVNEFQTRLYEYNTTLSDFLLRINGWEKQLDKISTDVVSIGLSGVEVHDPRIDVLEVKVALYGQALDALSQQVDEHIRVAERTFNDVDDSLTTLKRQVGEIDFSEVDGKISVLDGKIISLTGGLSTVDEKLLLMTSGLSALEEKISVADLDGTQKISALEAQINDEKFAVETVDADDIAGIVGR